VQVYPSIKAAARCAGVWPSQMQRWMKRAQEQEGCVWRFSEDGARDAEAREGRCGKEEVGWGREEGVEGMEEGEGAEEEDEQDTECSVCKKRDVGDRMLLCDGCDRGWHIFCLDPPLDNVPHGAWYCPVCIQGGGGGAKSDARPIPVWPENASELCRGVNDCWNSFQRAHKGRSVSTADWRAARAELWAEYDVLQQSEDSSLAGAKGRSTSAAPAASTLLRVPSLGDLDMFIPASMLDERAEGREGGGEAKEAASEPLKISGIGGKKTGCARVEVRGRGVQAGDMLQVGPEAYSKS
jgi:hypothetical protein